MINSTVILSCVLISSLCYCNPLVSLWNKKETSSQKLYRPNALTDLLRRIRRSYPQDVEDDSSKLLGDDFDLFTFRDDAENVYGDIYDGKKHEPWSSENMDDSNDSGESSSVIEESELLPVSSPFKNMLSMSMMQNFLKHAKISKNFHKKLEIHKNKKVDGLKRLKYDKNQMRPLDISVSYPLDVLRRKVIAETYKKYQREHSKNAEQNAIHLGKMG